MSSGSRRLVLLFQERSALARFHGQGKGAAARSDLALVNTTISLAAAFLFGTLIGVERQYRRRTAGLRANVLSAFSAPA